jgi:hypothetical protein
VRFKRNVKLLEHPLKTILNISGVSYEWRTEEFEDKNFEEGKQLGFIAQDLEAILPEAVLTDDQGWKSVKYSHITPVLVEAVKAQQTEILQMVSLAKTIIRFITKHCFVQRNLLKDQAEMIKQLQESVANIWLR